MVFSIFLQCKQTFAATKKDHQKEGQFFSCLFIKKCQLIFDVMLVATPVKKFVDAAEFNFES